MISRYTLSGRRRVINRRATDPGVGYLDRIDPGFAKVIGLIFVFQILDAGLTLRHVSRGGGELNPFMDMLIQRDPTLFLWIKLGFAGLGLAFLALHQTFPHVRSAVRILFGIFGALVVYHLFVIAVS